MNLSLPIRTLLALLISAALIGTIAANAAAGNYVVAECSPGLNPAAPDVGYTYSTNHYVPHQDCSPGGAGLYITHHLGGGETGTSQGAYGAWVFTAPPGTYIVGGSVFYRLATEDGQHGYLAVSPDAGAGTAFATQNDNQGHETGIPAGNWRYLVIRLECTQPNEGSRCVGQASGALASAKQIRIALADVSQPTLQDWRLALLGSRTARPSDRRSRSGRPRRRPAVDPDQRQRRRALPETTSPAAATRFPARLPPGWCPAR